MRCKGFFLVILFTLLAAPLFAETIEYTLTAPENKTNINFSKNSYNEIGALKITASENFDTNKKVVVTIKYDGRFTNSNNSSQTVNYNLVIGTSGSYKVLDSGGKIEFSATSIDTQTEVNIGAVITGDTVDGDYKTEINFSSVLLPVTEKYYNFGKYPDSNTNLIWRVLSVDETNKRALLLTEKCVDKMKYGKTSDNAWSGSKVREWLHGTFLINLGIDTDNILNIKIEDGEGQNKNSSEIIDASGSDKIFLLSSADIYSYLKDKSSRIATLDNLDNEAVRWWLRSPGKNNSSNAMIVQPDGGINKSGFGVYDNNHIYYVRPAIWLNFSNEQEKNSTTTLKFTKKTENNTNNDNSNSGSSSTAPVINPVTVINEDLKNLTEEELKEKFGSSSSVILYGDLSNADSQDVADLIEKIENVTELKTLDLSNVTGLTEILLPEDTKLQELNVKNSSTLIKIDVSNSPLTKLNTNGCVNLEILNCSSCGIIELEINGCSKLSELDCSYNSLTRLNLSGFEKLDVLKCEHQSINGVKIGENFNFIDFLFRIDSEIFSTAENSLSELNYIKDLQALNENGVPISFNLDENNGEISFSETPAVIKYNYQTNFKNILMDVNVAAAEFQDGKKFENTDNSNGSTGCCSSWGGVTFFALLRFLRLSRQKIKN